MFALCLGRARRYPSLFCALLCQQREMHVCIEITEYFARLFATTLLYRLAFFVCREMLCVFSLAVCLSAGSESFEGDITVHCAAGGAPRYVPYTAAIAGQ